MLLLKFINAIQLHRHLITACITYKLKKFTAHQSSRFVLATFNSVYLPKDMSPLPEFPPMDMPPLPEFPPMDMPPLDPPQYIALISSMSDSVSTVLLSDLRSHPELPSAGTIVGLKLRPVYFSKSHSFECADKVQLL